MDITAFRKTHRIGPECLIIQARLSPEFHEGWPLSHPHHFPTPLRIEEDGSLDAFAEDRFGIEYRAEPNSEGPFGTECDLVKDSICPCVLTLVLPTGRPYQAERIQVIREASSILTPLSLNHSTCVIVGICHAVVEYDHRFLRCLPIAIFTQGLVPLWVHPAAPAFGLIKCAWPRHQAHRELGELQDWSAWGPVIPADIEDPATGLPAWYARCQAGPSSIQGDSYERHGARLNSYGRLLHRLGEVNSLSAGFQRAQQEFRAGWSRIFAPGESPDPGHPLGYDQYESLVETLDILSDQVFSQSLTKSIQQARKGKTKGSAEVRRRLGI